uniref:Uncharacterized protein n=1 Tax=Alexandrium monilatum TaxID=311494 RepID=A0A7S4QG40_9DINO
MEVTGTVAPSTAAVAGRQSLRGPTLASSGVGGRAASAGSASHPRAALAAPRISPKDESAPLGGPCLLLRPASAAHEMVSAPPSIAGVSSGTDDSGSESSLPSPCKGVPGQCSIVSSAPDDPTGVFTASDLGSVVDKSSHGTNAIHMPSAHTTMEGPCTLEQSVHWVHNCGSNATDDCGMALSHGHCSHATADGPCAGAPPTPRVLSSVDAGDSAATALPTLGWRMRQLQMLVDDEHQKLGFGSSLRTASPVARQADPAPPSELLAKTSPVASSLLVVNCRPPRQAAPAGAAGEDGEGAAQEPEASSWRAAGSQVPATVGRPAGAAAARKPATIQIELPQEAGAVTDDSSSGPPLQPHSAEADGPSVASTWRASVRPSGLRHSPAPRAKCRSPASGITAGLISSPGEDVARCGPAGSTSAAQLPQRREGCCPPRASASSPLGHAGSYEGPSPRVSASMHATVPPNSARPQAAPFAVTVHCFPEPDSGEKVCTRQPTALALRASTPSDCSPSPAHSSRSGADSAAGAGSCPAAAGPQSRGLALAADPAWPPQRRASESTPAGLHKKVPLEDSSSEQEGGGGGNGGHCQHDAGRFASQLACAMDVGRQRRNLQQPADAPRPAAPQVRPRRSPGGSALEVAEQAAGVPAPGAAEPCATAAPERAGGAPSSCSAARPTVPERTLAGPGPQSAARALQRTAGGLPLFPSAARHGSAAAAAAAAAAALRVPPRRGLTEQLIVGRRLGPCTR